VAQPVARRSHRSVLALGKMAGDGVSLPRDRDRGCPIL